jgi:hypothetical protein
MNGFKTAFLAFFCVLSAFASRIPSGLRGFVENILSREPEIMRN